VDERGGLKMDEHFELPPGDALDALAAHSLPALVGIGATFKRDKTRGCYVVRRVIERGPADREGGIVPGDVISEVDVQVSRLGGAKAGQKQVQVSRLGGAKAHLLHGSAA
jgi:C-terminal processing protease CtpA/Prc